MMTPIDFSGQNKLFGNNLRECRLAAGLSQEELAHLAGVDRTYVSSCERGRRNLSLESIVRFAVALGIKPADLMVGLGVGEKSK